jgi:hypothetical protein
MSQSSSFTRTARRLIVDFYAQQCVPHDDDILQYVVALVTDQSVSPEALDELFSSCAPATWGALELDDRLAKLSGLLEQVE